MRALRSTKRAARWLLLTAAVLPWGAVQAANYVDGLGHEWLNLAAVQGYSWNQINAVCQSNLELAGPCSGLLGGTGYDVTGWTWANRAEVVGLLDSFVMASGDVSRAFELVSQHGHGSSFGWAPTLIAALGQTASAGANDQRTIGFMNGQDTQGFNTSAQLAFVCSGSPCGFVSYGGAGVSAGVPAATVASGWFYRNTTPVPEPTSLAMMLVGIAGMGALAARRRCTAAPASI